jgi:hypothetical protein
MDIQFLKGKNKNKKKPPADQEMAERPIDFLEPGRLPGRKPASRCGDASAGTEPSHDSFQ